MEAILLRIDKQRKNYNIQLSLKWDICSGNETPRPCVLINEVAEAFDWSDMQRAEISLQTGSHGIPDSRFKKCLEELKNRVKDTVLGNSSYNAYH
ncbi:hypothetical protein Tco_1276447 [Tanacetum coccineum]